MESILEEKEEGIIIGGNFKIRIGELDSLSEFGIERRSKDKKIGNRERNFLD